MNVFSFILLISIFVSCASEKSKFVPEKVCSNQALKYLRNPRNKTKTLKPHPAIFQELTKTSRDMQLCYQDFKTRTGHEEFDTCLVVGVDDQGSLDFYNFSSEEIKPDETFMSCAHAVTQSVPYQKYGNSYILIQSYRFFVDH
jgi:hypothetical protein